MTYILCASLHFFSKALERKSRLIDLYDILCQQEKKKDKKILSLMYIIVFYRFFCNSGRYSD